MEQKFQLTAKTLFGFEEILTNELIALGAENVKTGNRAVTFEGDTAFMYKANLCLHSALRVLKPVYSFKAKNEAELYRGMYEYDWSTLVKANGTIALDSAVNSPYFKNSKYAFLKAKDSIVDQFRNKTGIRPNIDLDNPDLRINLHIQDNEINVSLDSSGGSLHKRGYRIDVNEAPLNEVMAAGLIILSGWDRESNFVNPMCGSGTLLVEAAFLAYNIPPQTFRKNFGFQNWHDYDPQLWKRVFVQASSHQKDYKGILSGADISPDAVRIARTNVRVSQFENKIEITRKAFEKQDPPEGNGGIIIMNPPYGERMKDDDLTGMYKMIGDRLKQKFAGYQAWILISNKEAMKFVGLRPNKKYAFKAGPLELAFNNYSMYEGLG